MLYTILAMAVIVNVIVIVTNVVVIEVKQSANTDQSVRAFYTAESGVEKSLYHYRKLHERIMGGACGAPLTDCTIAASTSFVTSYPFRVDEQQTVEVSLEKSNMAGVWTEDIESAKLTWDNPSVWLEFSSVEWDPVAATWNDAGVNKVMLQGGSGIVNGLTKNKRYKIRIKSIDGLTSGNLSLYTGNNATGSQRAVSSTIILEGTGSYGNATQRVRATMPPTPTVGGLFDYVLFSEKAIIK